MSLFLTHNHTHRHTIILSRSTTPPLIHLWNQLSFGSGLMLSLSAYVSFGDFHQNISRIPPSRLILEDTFLPLEVRGGQAICFGKNNFFSKFLIWILFWIIWIVLIWIIHGGSQGQVLTTRVKFTTHIPPPPPSAILKLWRCPVL